MTGWTDTLLGNVITLKRGYDLPKRDRQDGAVPIVSSAGPTGFHNDAKAAPPGVVTGRYGTLGKVFYVDVPYWPLNTTLYVKDFKQSDERFVAYFLESMGLDRYDGAAAVPGLDRNVLHRLEVRWPSRDIQQSVAAVLAAYDELIENNLRRIEILEEMAQAVYREWFVNFRFPGHEDVPLVDSPLGAIPDGWKAATTAEAFEILGGATPSTKRDDYWTDGSINWFTPSDLTSHGQLFISRSSRQITPAGLAGCSASVFPEGSVMMTSRATIGVVAINTAPACTNQGFIVCLPNDQVSAFQIYFWIKANLAVIDSLASGATFKEISKRSFRTLSFVIPPGSVTQAFAATVGPIFELVENLITQNDNLRATRDLLLPKLVSGELDVSELDIETEWLAS